MPAYSPYAVAEHAMALLLTSTRKIHKAYIRTRDFNFSLQGLTGFDLHGKTVGVIGTVLVPWGAVLGMVAAMGTQCSIDFMDDKGRIIDIDGKVTDVLGKAVEAGNTVKDFIKDTTGSTKAKGLQEEKEEPETGLKDE